jgi:hypothetical protein
MTTTKSDWGLNDPVWIVDEIAGFFHQYTQDGRCRVGFSEYVTGRGHVGRWAEIPVTWIKEREVRRAS